MEAKRVEGSHGPIGMRLAFACMATAVLPIGDVMRDDDAMEKYLQYRNYNTALVKELRSCGKRTMTKKSFAKWKESLMDMDDDKPLKDYIRI